jgi:hypothetical protein
MRKLALLLILAGTTETFAASPVASHEPMHPTNAEMVTFTATAPGTVDKIRLAYRRATLSTAPDGSHVTTPVGGEVEVKVCDPPGTVANLACTHTMTTAFPAASLITYKATSFDAAGNAESDEYSFAAGDYPWPSDAIPVRAKSAAVRALDVVFIPDTDITVASFRAQLDDVVRLFFRYPQIEASRVHHNFYYSSIQGNYEETCSFTDPSNMAKLLLVGDTVAFLHSTTLRDCKSGKRFSSEIDYDKSIVHETGHAFFGLMDEYCCDSSYAQQACVPNLYASLAACEADAPNLGYQKSDCKQLKKGAQTINFWRVDPNGAGGCMMGDAQHTTGSVFQKACVRRMNHRYAKCAAGNCFPSPECP